MQLRISARPGGVKGRPPRVAECRLGQVAQTGSAMPGGVLLFTGFPGFIGARLIPRLLELRPGSSFRCLVQERFEAAAREQIGAIEKRYPAARGRIATVLGDITQERLGLAPAAAKALQAELSGAYHLAAVYDLAVRRDIGMRINVLGTRNVIAFLEGAGKLERFDYVSTAYVSGTAVGSYREGDLDVGQSFKNYYEETKFLAEVAVAKSGLPFATYRPGIVVGDSRSGETAKFDGPYFVLSAMERTPSPGVFPRVGSGRNATNLVPVDFVVEALAKLSCSDTSLGKTYHLTDPDPLSVADVSRLFARALGKSFVYVPVPLRVAKLLFAPALVQRFFGMPMQSLDYFDHPCRYDASQANADLAQLDVRCPRLPDYLDRLIAFYLENKSGVRRNAMI
jgi:thioester reductase-like protein